MHVTSVHADDDDFQATMSYLRATAMDLSMGTNIVNKEKVVSGTCSEDSVTLCLSSLRVPQDLVELDIVVVLSLQW